MPVTADSTRERLEWLDAVRDEVGRGALPLSAFVAAYVLSSYVNAKSRVAWASQAVMAARIGLREETFMKLTVRLSKLGYIAKSRRGPRGPGGSTNNYRLTRPLRPAAAAPNPHLDAPSERGKVHIDAPATCIGGRINSLSEIFEDSPSPPASVPASGASEIEAAERLADEEWGRFAQAYPFHGAMSRTDARREFLRLDAASRARAIREAATFRAACEAHRRDHPVDAVTWLRKREFDHNPLPAAAANGQAVAGSPAIFVPEGSAAFDAWDRYNRRKSGVDVRIAAFNLEQGRGIMRDSAYPPGSDSAPRAATASSSTSRLSTGSSDGK
jgi:hypothetical protein